MGRFDIKRETERGGIEPPLKFPNHSRYKTDREAERETDRDTDRQAERETERARERERERRVQSIGSIGFSLTLNYIEAVV